MTDITDDVVESPQYDTHRIIDDLETLYKEKELLDAKLKIVEGAITEKEYIVLEKLRREELQALVSEASSGTKYKFSLTKKTVPNCRNYEDVLNYAKSNNDFEIFTRAIRLTRAQALWEKGVEIPGIEKFEKISLSVRKVQ